MVNFVLSIRIELKTWEKLWPVMPITSWLGGFNTKASGSWEWSLIFFFWIRLRSHTQVLVQTPFQNIAHLLGRTKISDYYKNFERSYLKNRKIYFPFILENCAKLRPKIQYRFFSRGGGVCISLTRNDPVLFAFDKSKYNYYNKKKTWLQHVTTNQRFLLQIKSNLS